MKHKKGEKKQFDCQIVYYLLRCMFTVCFIPMGFCCILLSRKLYVIRAAEFYYTIIKEEISYTNQYLAAGHLAREGAFPLYSVCRGRTFVPPNGYPTSQPSVSHKKE